MPPLYFWLEQGMGANSNIDRAIGDGINEYLARDGTVIDLRLLAGQEANRHLTTGQELYKSLPVLIC